jgi:hypothetical protein
MGRPGRIVEKMRFDELAHPISSCSSGDAAQLFQRKRNIEKRPLAGIFLNGGVVPQGNSPGNLALPVTQTGRVFDLAVETAGLALQHRMIAPMGEGLDLGG